MKLNSHLITRPLGTMGRGSLKFVPLDELGLEDKARLRTMIGDNAKCSLKDLINIAEVPFAAYKNENLVASARVFTGEFPNEQQQLIVFCTPPNEVISSSLAQCLREKGYCTYAANLDFGSSETARMDHTTVRVQMGDGYSVYSAPNGKQIKLKMIEQVPSKVLLDVTAMEKAIWGTSHRLDFLETAIYNRAAFMRAAYSMNDELLGFWLAFNGFAGSNVLFGDVIAAKEGYKLGTALHNDLVSFARAHRYEDLLFDVSPYNAKVLNLVLNKSGGRLVDFIQNWYDQGSLKESRDRCYAHVHLRNGIGGGWHLNGVPEENRGILIGDLPYRHNQTMLSVAVPAKENLAFINTLESLFNKGYRSSSCEKDDSGTPHLIFTGPHTQDFRIKDRERSLKVEGGASM